MSRSIGPGSKGLSVSMASLSKLSCSRAWSCVVRVAAISDRSFGGRGGVDGIAIIDGVLRRVALSVEFTASSGLAPLVEFVHTWQRVVGICHQGAKCIPDAESPSAAASYNCLLNTFISFKVSKVSWLLTCLDAYRCYPRGLGCPPGPASKTIVQPSRLLRNAALFHELSFLSTISVLILPRLRNTTIGVTV